VRTLDWDGANNIRDLGGLDTPLSATGSTRWGRVARGPRREALSASGWEAASAWGLRSVVDLRNVDEAGLRDSDPGALVPEGLVIAATPTEDRNNAEFRAVCLPILGSPEYWQHNVRILPALVRGALEAIAASEPGVLVHCSAGRDRTGMVTALLLANAGVSGDDIFADYSESVRAMAGAALRGGTTDDWQAEWPPEQVDAWLAEIEPHVRDFVADPDAVFERLGVGADTRGALRSLLTE
jgi:protein-tyrosine phosphatase